MIWRRPRPVSSTGCWRWWRVDDGGPRPGLDARAGRCSGAARTPESPGCRCHGVRRWSGEVPVADRGGVSWLVLTWTASCATSSGLKTARTFADVLEIETVGELLRHYPRRYLKKGELTPFDELEVGDQATVSGRVKKVTLRSLESKAEIQLTEREELPQTQDAHQGRGHRRQARPGAGVLQPALAGGQAAAGHGRAVLGRGDDVPDHQAAEGPRYRDPRGQTT